MFVLDSCSVISKLVLLGPLAWSSKEDGRREGGEGGGHIRISNRRQLKISSNRNIWWDQNEMITIKQSCQD
jgi:hypothetical protein